MIKYVTGNILESNTQAIVNTVNCEGYMGKGIAYQFKLKYPENNKVYVDACREGNFKIGDILDHEEDGKVILNFPTKDKWREKSQYSYIEKGVDTLGKLIKRKGIQSVSIPPLGCGNGGLEWGKVKKILNDNLSYIEAICEVLIYEPSDNLSFIRNQKIKQAPKLSTSHLLLILIKKRLFKFNKLRLQKAAYMINLFSGQDYFKFDAHNFGPYAHSIDILSREIKEYQNYFGIDTDEAFSQVTNILISSNTLNKVNSFKTALDKSIYLVNSFQDDKKLELVTTILFIIDKSKTDTSFQELLMKIHDWNDHKRHSFDGVIVLETVENLLKIGLLKQTLYGDYQLNV